MTKTQMNENNYNTPRFNFTRYKIMVFLIGGALAIFGVFKLIAYTENRKLEADRQALAELMKDESFRDRMEFFAKPNPSKEEKFIFYCQMLGLKKSHCEYYNSLNNKVNNTSS